MDRFVIYNLRFGFCGVVALWEQLHNPNLNSIEFDGFKMESFNSELIKQQMPADERLANLNQIAIDQMKILVANKSIKKLKE
ncbi:MAG: hypothetical protein JXA99_12380 [Candidatus Lokiarchaeota archaeon]|nr:hypothetical protein [Candidatus Lokiarchaeota archaeon]